MSNFRRLVKKLRIDSDAFHDFHATVVNPANADPRKRFFDSYNENLRRIEIAYVKLESFIMENIDKADFEARLKRRQERIKALERVSLDRLERIFEAYKRNRQGLKNSDKST
jgi:hypothetical protein